MIKRQIDVHLDRERLRLENYNATVLSIRRCHDELMIMRVRPDRGVEPYFSGQFTVLGLGYWESRAAGCQSEGEINKQKLIKRAYSISCPMLENSHLVCAGEMDWLEFYITLVRSAQSPPALTPRLFALEAGDRIFCSPVAHGRYTLHGVHRDQAVILAGTGTGEAPHNAMTAQLLRTGHRGPIVNAACVPWKQDLGYLDVHRELESRHGNYHYVALTTREPENLDASYPGFVGKRYLQDLFTSGELDAQFGAPLDPADTHVFLCGNPAMIGAPQRTHDPGKRYPEPQGMVEILERRGFEIDRPHHPGNIHYESYW